MNRLQAIQYLRAGGTLVKIFEPYNNGIDCEVEVWLRHEEICDFKRSRQSDHIRIGPIHCRLFDGEHRNWLHVTPMQVLQFIKRNYDR